MENVYENPNEMPKADKEKKLAGILRKQRAPTNRTLSGRTHRDSLAIFLPGKMSNSSLPQSPFSPDTARPPPQAPQAPPPLPRPLPSQPPTQARVPPPPPTRNTTMATMATPEWQG